MSESTTELLRRRILNALAVSSGAGRRLRRRAFSGVESLEDRRLLSAVTPQVDTTPVYDRSKAAAAGMVQSAGTAVVPLDQTFTLNSRPGATKTIYLDFDGNTTSGTIWNTAFTGGASITTPPFSLD